MLTFELNESDLHSEVTLLTTQGKQRDRLP